MSRHKIPKLKYVFSIKIKQRQKHVLTKIILCYYLYIT